MGELLTRWSVRLAVACYIGRMFLDVNALCRSSSPAIGNFGRWLWTIGFLALMAHVAFAFHSFHSWSHGQAFAHTATQTEAVTGIHWGGGLYFNYAFTLFWGIDVIASWRRAAIAHPPSSVYFWIVHGVFSFMVFNATVVFGPPGWRWVGLGVGVALAVVAVRARQNRSRTGSADER